MRWEELEVGGGGMEKKGRALGRGSCLIQILLFTNKFKIVDPLDSSSMKEIYA